VPHHGSKTSSTEGFVLATKPGFAIISVGRNSRFGHPHKDVVDRWRSNGATVLTTGECGTITVTTDGHDLRLSAFIRG
jgi:competence protein ComEC